MAQIHLSEETKQRKTELEHRRLRAMALVDAGYLQKQAASEVGVTESALSNWMKSRRTGGIEALRARYGKTGSKCRLSEAQLEELVRIIAGPPRTLGIDADVWTLERIRDVVQQRLGVEYRGLSIYNVLNRQGMNSPWWPRKRGRTAKLNAEQARQLEAMLIAGPRANGIDADLWTLARISVLVQERFGVNYALGSVAAFLRRIGWGRRNFSPHDRERLRRHEPVQRWRKAA